MAILIGVDEAGYGPNYGPLCVAASAWRVEAEEVGGRRSEVSGGAEGSRGKRAGPSPGPAAAQQILRPKPRAATRDAAPDLYKLLKKCVARSPDKAGRKIAIADSKALYSPQAGVRQLERGVLAALAVLRANDEPSPEGGQSQFAPRTAQIRDSPRRFGDERRCHESVAELLAAVLGDPDGRRHELACHSGDALALPLESEAAEIAKLATRLAAVSNECGVELVALRARLVYPAEFNALCDEWGSKGAALSHVTLGLVRAVVDGCASSGAKPQADGGAALIDDGATYIYLDKHGGRNQYAGLVQHHFAECWVDVLAEGRAESRYTWEHAGRRVEAAFRVGCEAMLPTALASMTAKYLRETAMRAFNAFWAERVPGLRPTAGYPGDARRFREEIAAVQAALGIEDRVIWRSR
jgi:ribonuclease HII